MNWIERMYELKGKDPYSQNGEGIYLEYILHNIQWLFHGSYMIDIGGGDGFYLSNTYHLLKSHVHSRCFLDKENGHFITAENVIDKLPEYIDDFCLLSIDIDGNDYHIIQKVLSYTKPAVIIAEFNPAFSDSRTIKYNPDHVWDGTDYYGFSFEAGKKLFEKHGYKVIFNVANMNMIAVREDLINVTIPTVTYQVTEFFEKSTNREWVFI